MSHTHTQSADTPFSLSLNSADGAKTVVTFLEETRTYSKVVSISLRKNPPRCSGAGRCSPSECPQGPLLSINRCTGPLSSFRRRRSQTTNKTTSPPRITVVFLRNTAYEEDDHIMCILPPIITSFVHRPQLIDSAEKQARALHAVKARPMHLPVHISAGGAQY